MIPPGWRANIGIVLDHTRHAANIGAVCRVMKNLGFCNLHLVSPTEFGHLAAIRMIQGAELLLLSSYNHGTVNDAVNSFHYAFATSHRMKQDEAIDLRAAAEEIACRAQTDRIAILFGSEKFGLPRDDVDRCNKIISLPVDPGFPSINLAQAVAMVCVEIRLAMDMLKNGVRKDVLKNTLYNSKINLTIEKRQRFYSELFSLFTSLNMREPAVKKKIQAVFERTNMSERELNLFYGFFKEIRNLREKM